MGSAIGFWSKFVRNDAVAVCKSWWETTVFRLVGNNVFGEPSWLAAPWAPCPPLGPPGVVQVLFLLLSAYAAYAVQFKCRNHSHQLAVLHGRIVVRPRISLHRCRHPIPWGLLILLRSHHPIRRSLNRMNNFVLFQIIHSDICSFTVHVTDYVTSYA